MTAFLLVHGAWHGGWCWRRVADILRREGHTVFTPTLTGLGERAHLAGPDIDLDCHINDVLGVLNMEELNDVVICGHSYGGQVITPVLDQCVELFRAAVWLDAFVPEDGQSLVDNWPPERARQFREEFSLCIAFQNILGNLATLIERDLQSLGISLVQKNLRLQNFRRFLGD